MLPAKSLKFLEKLMNCSGPSGFEEETAGAFREYLKEFSSKVFTDVMGNTAGVVNPGGAYRVMLAGHYDEIGFQVVYISDEGLIYFRPNGGIDKLTVPGCEVDILTAKGRVPGVIGKKPIHLLTPKEREIPPELNDLWIDIGAENKKEAAKLISIGDPVTIRSNYQRLGKNRIKSKGMDDKVGAFVVAETLRCLSARKLKVEVFGVGTVQEELGLRGVATSCFGIIRKSVSPLTSVLRPTFRMLPKRFSARSSWEAARNSTAMPTTIRCSAANFATSRRKIRSNIRKRHRTALPAGPIPRRCS